MAIQLPGVRARLHHEVLQAGLFLDGARDRLDVRPARNLSGGASLGSPRHIWWNFVSSSKERIEQAKEEWRTAKFDIVPGDEEEYIPLPET